MTRIRTTVSGIVGTKPTLAIRATSGGELRVAQFRLAVVDRYRDFATQEWRDGETQWITVSAFRELANNICESFDKGERVFVEGLVRVNEYQTADLQPRVELRIEAKTAGHDLAFGRSRFTRLVRKSTSGAEGETDETSTTRQGDEFDGATVDEATGEIVPDDAQRETTAATSVSAAIAAGYGSTSSKASLKTKKDSPTSADSLISAPF